MTRLKADVVWRTDGPNSVSLHPRLLELLRSVQRHATLRAACEEVDLSYRAAWGLLLDATALLGAPLAELQRGRGARLTRLGASLLRSDDQMRHAIGPLSERLGVATDATAAAGGAALRLAASHDLLLAEFCSAFARPAGLIDEISFRGSEESLRLLGRGACDLAGFHVADGERDSPLRRLLKPKRDRLVRFAGREQGLIVAHGNPKRLASLADVAQKHAQFVNRQKGSGTRLIVDRLLAERGIAPSQINGYATEEYTHLAVAATIAAGRADAGFGVQAAAAQFGLEFVPAVHEHYWLALREHTLATAPAQRLLVALTGKPLARAVRGLPGYDCRGAGDIVKVEEAFA